jgi:hypothetical protein
LRPRWAKEGARAARHNAVSVSKRFVSTAAIRNAVKGRETDVLEALGIQWNGKASHIVCPYPDHPDREPSWRWDDSRKVAFCSCIGTRPGENKGHSIFGVIGTKEGLDREAARMRAAEIIGRPDLIIRANRHKYQRTDAAALLNPPPENQDDALAWSLPQSPPSHQARAGTAPLDEGRRYQIPRLLRPAEATRRQASTRW